MSKNHKRTKTKYENEQKCPAWSNNSKAEQLKLKQQHGQVDWGQQGFIMSGSPGAWS